MYEYEPLDRNRKEIRLLTLQPGSGDDMLFCALATAYLDLPAPPHYETISYVCGNQTIKATINLQGSDVQVPATSEAALRCMRLRDKPRILWIDAICINQADFTERGHQVGMMYEIYTQTSHNLVYLGLDDSEMPRIVESMDAIWREILDEIKGGIDAYTTLHQRKVGLTGVQFSIDIEQSGLLAFFGNPWFTRLWVVQEVSLSPSSTCHVRGYSAPLELILRVAKWLFLKWNFLPEMSHEQMVGILNAMFVFETADKTFGDFQYEKSDLWKFINRFALFNTTNRKDRIFALIPLWQMHTRTSVLPSILQPDYTLGVPEVFGNVCRFAI